MKKVVFLCASFLVALVVIEVIARLGFDQPQFYRNMRHDPECGFRMPSNLRLPRADRHGAYVYWTNSLGFRSHAFPHEPRLADDGRTRMLFVGDSFLNAYAVRGRELMTERVERMVAKETGLPTRSFCISGDGLSPSQELILLRKYGKIVSPDAVILALCPDNDVGTSTPLLHGYAFDYLRPYIVSNQAGVRTTTYLHPGRTWLRRASRAFALLEHRLVTGGVWSNAQRYEAADPLTRLKEGRAPTWRLEVYDPAAAEKSPWREAWSAVTQLLLDFKTEAESLHARFLVLVIPSLRQVESDVATLVEDTRCRAVTEKGLCELLDLNLPERKIGRFCEANGIDYRLLAGPLRRRTGVGRLSLYSRNMQLSGEGHRVAAETVAAWWSERPDQMGGDLRSVLRGAPATRLPPIDEQPNAVQLLPGRRHYLDKRWSISRRWKGFGPGAMTSGKSGAIAVPARPGYLVVRGSIPRSAKLPFNVGLEVPSLAHGGLTLHKHGPFIARIPSPLPERLRPPAYYGYVAALVSCERAGPMIHSAGFEVPRVVPYGRSTGCAGVIWATERLRPGRTFEIQGTGAPAEAEGLVIFAKAPAMPAAKGRPAIYVNTAAILAAVPVKADIHGRFSATLDVPDTLAKPIVVQGLFGQPGAKTGFAATRAVLARPFLGKKRR